MECLLTTTGAAVVLLVEASLWVLCVAPASKARPIIRELCHRDSDLLEQVTFTHTYSLVCFNQNGKSENQKNCKRQQEYIH